MSNPNVAAQNAGGAVVSRAQLILHGITALIALVGLTDATYLTVIHLTGDDAACGPSSGCSVVLNSVYATIVGIPTAGLGAVAYFTAFSCAILAAFGYARAQIFLGVVVTPMFIMSLGLLYVQAFVLHAFCPYCLLSAALTFFLAGVILITPRSV